MLPTTSFATIFHSESDDSKSVLVADILPMRQVHPSGDYGLTADAAAPIGNLDFVLLSQGGTFKINSS